MAALEMGTDYRGESVTASLTAANPDLLAGTGIIIINLPAENLASKTVHSNWFLGEFAFYN